MSNCIAFCFSTGHVYFSRDEIRVQDFLKLMSRVYDKDLHELAKEDDNTEETAWWFLARNHDLHVSEEYVFGDKKIVDINGLTIRFGEGRSAHTWRDFHATLVVLCQMMRQEKWLEFTMSDESDGFNRRYKAVYLIGSEFVQFGKDIIYDARLRHHPESII